MKRLLITASSLIAMTMAVQAADLPSRTAAPLAPVYAPPAFTWAGFYFGVNAGYAWSESNRITYSGNTPVQNFINSGIFPNDVSPGSASGFTGGAQAGYNWQSGSFVYGLETDIGFVDSGKSGTVVTLAGSSATFSRDTSYLGTIRARLGYTPTDRLLIYATGGFAYGGAKVSGALSTPAGAAFAGSSDGTRTGWTLGGGLEYAIASNWTAKLEYLYYDLGSRNANLVAVNGSAIATAALPTIRTETKGNIVRAGINYKW